VGVEVGLVIMMTMGGRYILWGGAGERVVVVMVEEVRGVGSGSMGGVAAGKVKIRRIRGCDCMVLCRSEKGGSVSER